MSHFLIRKTFYGVSILTVGFGLFLYFIDDIAEQAVSYFWGQAFYYVEHPFLKLIYLLVIFVSFALFNKIDCTEKFKESQKTQLALRYMSTLIIATLIGFLIHLFTVVHTMNTDQSLYELEQNFVLYHLTDFVLVLGFVIAGLRLRKELN